MKALKVFRHLPSGPLAPSAVTIGNFDGLHRGHYALFLPFLKKAKEKQLIPTVITFEPLPQTFFTPQRPLLRLTPFRQKIVLLRAWGIEQLLCIRFNQRFATLSAHEFIKKYLVHGLNAHYVMVGADFRFGYQRQGDLLFLQEEGQHNGFIVETVDFLMCQQQKISSTLIRQALLEGEISCAQRWLGRPYQIEGKVIYGKQRGRLLGFPTANLAWKKNYGKWGGVFITRVKVGERWYWGATNVGNRPTVDGGHSLVETHLLDFSQNLYGKPICVEFIKKLRDEKKFTDKEALCQQIAHDVAQVRLYGAMTE